MAHYIPQFVSGNELAISTLFQSSTGAIGLGTSDPSQKFTISSGSVGLGHGYGLVWGTNAIGGLTTGGNALHFDTSGTERVRIDEFGNVGIGTTTPTERLHVLNSSGPALIKLIGPGNTWDYSGIRMISDEAIDKAWQITHRKDLLNKLVWHYFN